MSVFFLARIGLTVTIRLPKTNLERDHITMASSYSDEMKQEKRRAAELAELGDLIEELPEEYRIRFEKAYRRALNNVERRRRILSFIQDSISQLRLDMKYLIFDLEATRRERDEYRRQLEEIR